MSKTVTAQQELEAACLPLLQAETSPPSLASLKSKHAAFLRFTLGLDQSLPAAFLALDASHPWIVFWSVNALYMLNKPLSPQELDRIGETILSYQHPEGGFGGGPGQPGHMAATYAAVMALAHTGPKFWNRIHRESLLTWILSLKTSEGSIRVCAHGEADPRATYCALAVATLLGINTAELRHKIGDYLSKCQTYEGGFANEPFGEAHGGYAFCSLASLMLLHPQTPQKAVLGHCDVSNFQRWLVARQDLRVPGFSGRTNKLVDGCYSHWVGGCWPLVSQVSLHGGSNHRPDEDLFSRRGLHDYTIKCCQNAGGGLRDKPGVRPDAYHSNYTLCGLACAQYRYTMGSSVFDWQACEALAIDEANSVPAINPVFGVPLGQINDMKKWVDDNPVVVKSRRSFSRAASIVASPSSREYQGFALYLGATFVLFVYIAWAVLPASWLHAIRIDYYPSRWWAVAVPAYLLMLMLYMYAALSLYNREKLTYPAESLETLCDKNTKVHDVPLVDVNARLYNN